MFKKWHRLMTRLRQGSASVKIEGRTLTVDGLSVVLAGTIRDWVVAGDVVVVVIDMETPENVFGVSRKGAVLWQVPNLRSVEYEGEEMIGITRGYYNVSAAGGHRVVLHGDNGEFLEMDARTGTPLTNVAASRRGRRPW
jgi:hypothetical protein